MLKVNVLKLAVCQYLYIFCTYTENLWGHVLSWWKLASSMLILISMSWGSGLSFKKKNKIIIVLYFVSLTSVFTGETGMWIRACVLLSIMHWLHTHPKPTLYALPHERHTYLKKKNKTGKNSFLGKSRYLNNTLPHKVPRTGCKPAECWVLPPPHERSRWARRSAGCSLLLSPQLKGPWKNSELL